MAGDSKGPARGYSWPPFAPGHTLSMRHGARSVRVIEPLAADLLKCYLEERPDLVWAHGTLEQLARTEARALLLDRWLAEAGMFDEEGKLRGSALREWRLLEGRAANIRHSLGWTPRARAAMVRDESLAITPWVSDVQRESVAAEQVERWLATRDGAEDD